MIASGSSYISGKDKLNVRTTKDIQHSLQDKVATPKRVVDELENILHTIIANFQESVLQDLQAFLLSDTPEHLLPSFFILFILLHLIEHISGECHRHALGTSIKVCYKSHRRW